MEFNFDKYEYHDFVIKGRRIRTLEDCKDWIANKALLNDWIGLLRKNYPYELIREYEDQALDLHLYLFLKGKLGD